MLVTFGPIEQRIETPGGLSDQVRIYVDGEWVSSLWRPHDDTKAVWYTSGFLMYYWRKVYLTDVRS